MMYRKSLTFFVTILSIFHQTLPMQTSQFKQATLKELALPVVAKQIIRSLDNKDYQKFDRDTKRIVPDLRPYIYYTFIQDSYTSKKPYCSDPENLLKQLSSEKTHSSESISFLKNILNLQQQFALPDISQAKQEKTMSTSNLYDYNFYTKITQRFPLISRCDSELNALYILYKNKEAQMRCEAIYPASHREMCHCNKPMVLAQDSNVAVAAGSLRNFSLLVLEPAHPEEIKKEMEKEKYLSPCIALDNLANMMDIERCKHKLPRIPLPNISFCNDHNPSCHNLTLFKDGSCIPLKNRFELVGMALSPKGNFLITVPHESSVRGPFLFLWDLTTQKVATTLLKNKLLTPDAVAVSNSGIVAAGDAQYAPERPIINIWFCKDTLTKTTWSNECGYMDGHCDIKKPDIKLPFSRNPDNMPATIMFSPCEQYLIASSSEEGEEGIKIWKRQGNSFISDGCLPHSDDRVYKELLLSPSGRYLVGYNGQQHKNIKIWDFEKRTFISEFQVEATKGEISSVQFEPHESFLVVVTKDEFIVKNPENPFNYEEKTFLVHFGDKTIEHAERLKSYILPQPQAVDNAEVDTTQHANTTKCTLKRTLSGDQKSDVGEPTKKKRKKR